MAANGPAGPQGPPGGVGIRVNPAGAFTDTGGGSGVIPGTIFSVTIPLSAYTFSVGEFPLLLGVAQTDTAIAALSEVYVTHPTSTTWDANISAQVLDTTSGDRISYTVYYLGARNVNVF
jgi:hypothetical protein